MITEAEVEAVIYKAIISLNVERGPEDQIALSPATVLFGTDSRIDSLGFVSIIVDVESMLTSEYRLQASLADDRALARTQSPYATVAALRDYVLELAQES